MHLANVLPRATHRRRINNGAAQRKEEVRKGFQCRSSQRRTWCREVEESTRTGAGTPPVLVALNRPFHQRGQTNEQLIYILINLYQKYK